MNDQHIEQRLRSRMPNSWDLMDDIQKLACTIAYSIGHDDGFVTAHAAESGIVSVQRKIQEMESAPVPTSEDLADTSKLWPGADSYLDTIVDALGDVPNSGYQKGLPV